jgi:RNA polymerase sigma-70 factor (ECF subfamily)
MDDNKILDLYWARAETAITETSRKYNSYCFSIAKNILHDNQDAEECVNDMYLKVWNAVPPARPTFFQAYLGKTTRNLSFNKYKQTKTQKRGGGDTALLLSELEECIPCNTNVETQYETELTSEAINACLLLMEQEMRLVFVRRYYFADCIKDISTRYKMSESKVKSMLHRARGRLKEHLEKEGVTI